MKDDLNFNNIPSAELEKLSQEIDKTVTPVEAVSAEQKAELQNTNEPVPKPQTAEPNTYDISDNSKVSEQHYDKNTEVCAQTADFSEKQIPNTPTENLNNTASQNDNKNNIYYHSKTQSPSSGFSGNSYPRTNTLRNKNPYPQNNGNTYPQNGYQCPPNTSNNSYPRTNTLRNKNSYPRTNTLRNKNAYPQNNANAYPQNGYQYQTNTSNNSYPRTNTLRNKNTYPQNNANAYPQNGYQYAPNTSNNSYPRTNTLRNRNACPPNTFNNAYPQNGYQYPPNMGYPQYGQTNPMQQNRIYAGAAYNPGQAPGQPLYFYQPNPKEMERLALAKDCSTAGGATIAIFIVMFVVAIIIEVAAIFCGVTRDMPDLANDPYAGFTPMGFYMYEGLTSLLSVFLPALIILKASGRKLANIIPFKKIEGKKLAAIVMCGMSLCMVAQLMATLIGVNLGLFGIDIYKGLETATATGVLDLIMGSICTAIIPALVEEFAYRGLVAGILKEHDEMLAVFGSAFLFGMLHGNFAQIPFAFVVGLVLGYIRVKTDSMLPGILIHFGNNFYAVVITILGELLPDPYSTIVDSAVILLIIVIGFISTNYLIKNHKDLFKVERKDSYLTYKEKLSTFMKTGTVIASIIILSIMSFAILAAV